MVLLCAVAASLGFAGLPWQIPAALVVVLSLSQAEDTMLRSIPMKGSASPRLIGTALIEAGVCCLAWAAGAAIGALALI